MTEILTTPVAGAADPFTRVSTNRPEGSTGAVVSEKKARIEKACEDMEALFVHQLIKEMRAAIPKGGLFEQSNAQEIYTGMLDARMAQEISQNRGLGISALLMRQLGGPGGAPEDESG